jgi:hypothetical protein
MSLAALFALAGAGNAAAQALEPDSTAVGDAGAGLAQVAQQATGTVQDAAAQATAVQEGAANVASPTVTASPGAETTVTQTNNAVADSVAANESETTQAAGQTQAANGSSSASQPSTTGQGQAAQQGSSTTQAAGAQATTVQTQPINVAIPIVIGSPGATTVVNQANNAAAGASATNTATTTQVAGQVQSSLPPGGSGQAQSPPTPGGGSGQAGGGAPVGGIDIDQILGTIATGGSPTLIWIWNWEWNWNWGDWNWNWNPPAVDIPTVPSIPSVPAWPFPKPPAFQDQARDPKHGLDESTGAGESGGSIVAVAAQAGELPPGPPFTGSSTSKSPEILSSNIVQQAAKPQPEPFLLPPFGQHVAPAGTAGGAGIAPLTLVVGALLALLLQLSTAAGLLGRRLSLEAVGWRRQAYLAPLERPG